jgi:hypothetical protein
MVSIALILRFGNPHIFPNDLTLIFYFLEDLRLEDLSFADLAPMQWCSTPSPIQGFKRYHLKTSLVAIIVGEFCV